VLKCEMEKKMKATHSSIQYLTSECENRQQRDVISILLVRVRVMVGFSVQAV